MRPIPSDCRFEEYPVDVQVGVLCVMFCQDKVSTMAGKPPYYAGIDVGGTNIKAGVVDCEGTPLGKASVPTEAIKGPDSGVANIKLALKLALPRQAWTTCASSCVRSWTASAPTSP